MIAKQPKKMLLIFLVGILIGLSSAAVYATNYDSPYGYYGPFLGYSYENQGRVSDSQGWPDASSLVTPTGTDVPPAGYMGAQARLFKNDALYLTSSMQYTSSTVTNFRVYVNDYPASSSGVTFYSKGITAAYNGNGYSNYYTFQSPSMNW